ncbi:MAG: lytic transglycosylase domain-containing protein [Chloroflexi bacterium]|nr:lytic transglycosylase domain-containing protein [Chloroflexota bacterium]
MAILSAEQVYALVKSVGANQGEAVFLTAVAWPESQYNTDAVNRSSGATGLFQIHPGGPQYLDPTTNAKTALGKLRSQGKDAWSAWPGSKSSEVNASGFAKGEQMARDAAGKVEGDPSLAERLAGMVGAGPVGETIAPGATLDKGVEIAKAGVLAALKALFNFSLVRRLAMISAGTALMLIGALALGVDIAKAALGAGDGANRAVRRVAATVKTPAATSAA